MKKTRIAAVILSLLLVLGCVMTAVNAVAPLSGEVTHEEETLYEGVQHALITTTAETPTYNKQRINVVTFDLKQRDLYLETAYYNNSALVNYGGSTVENIMKQYDQTHADKTAIAAVNGDMWMVSYAHARIEGKEHTNAAMGGYTDDVVKKELTVSRSFNIVDGEIFTTSQIMQETPYAGMPWAFCITDDFVPNLGQPYAVINMTDVNLSTTVKIDGINRLPANNAAIMYTDRVMSTYNGFALDDAYEMLIEFDEDYTMRHGANVTGKLKAIYSSESTENPPKITNKQMVITVRGNRVDGVRAFSIGDDINFTVEIHDQLGNDDIWQRAVNSIGGNIVYAKNGAYVSNGIESGYPTTMLGYDKDGKIIMLTMDGRGKGGVGASPARYYQLYKDLGLYEVFILDGGGSMTMVVSDGTNYTPVSTPIDSGGTAYRTVNNALILAHGPERCEQGEFVLMEEIPHIEDATNVTFPTEAHVRAFVGAPNETVISWEDECLKLTVTNMTLGDPYASFSYLSADPLASADVYKFIVLVYKMPETNSVSRYGSELFCQCQNRGAEGGQSAMTNVKRTGKYECAVFNASSLTKWKGDITGLRIDYFSGGMQEGDCILIHNIMLAETKADARALGAAVAEQLNNPPETEPEETETEPDVTETDPEESGTEPEDSETDPEESGTEPEENLRGDCNKDGAVDNKDVVALFRYVSSGVTAEDESVYDFDEDETVNNKDVVALFRYISSVG
ncbi:MAG: phosphodiester glycosidase family protein [Clostridia bacterium]|nr:phosphodiester glycosidase family protein [Clostridia bacterium]